MDSSDEKNTNQDQVHSGDQLISETTLSSDQLEQIKVILWQYLEPRETKAFIFGSQATGSRWRGSDLDIGVEGRVSAGQLAGLREALEESTLPYTIDVVDFNQMSPTFITHAKTNTIAL